MSEQRAFEQYWQERERHLHADMVERFETDDPIVTLISVGIFAILVLILVLW